jgi:hypothetical protein
MEFRILTKREQELCKNNLADIQAYFKFCTRKCIHCNYPLSGLIDHPHSIELNGPLCELCHTLEFVLRGKKGLEYAHQQWKDDQKKKKQILEQDGNSYFK